MSFIRDQVLATFHEYPLPVSSAMLARFIGRQTMQVTGCVAKLRAYGFIEIARVDRSPGHQPTRFYRLKEART